MVCAHLRGPGAALQPGLWRHVPADRPEQTLTLLPCASLGAFIGSLPSARPGNILELHLGLQTAAKSSSAS